jgi:HAD superfamily hydrolase (TIGR01549 family)
VAARFDAVLFDAGGVLVLPDPTVLGPLLAPYGAATSAEAHRRAHHGAMRALDVDGEVHDDWSVYNVTYVRLLGVTEQDLVEAAFLLGRTRSPMLWRWPVPGSTDVLRALAAAGVPIGVVSNASGQIEATLRRAGVCQVGPGAGASVVVVVDSHVVGVAKPDPAIFAPALDALGLPPARVAYVGDSVINDVVGARAAGLQPLHLDPYDDHPGADYDRISSLADLLTIVSG